MRFLQVAAQLAGFTSLARAVDLTGYEVGTFGEEAFLKDRPLTSFSFSM